MSRKKVHTLRNKPVSEHVQNVPENTFLPPGAQDASQGHVAAPEADEPAIQIGDEQPKEGAEYPAVKVTDEETHKAQEEAEAAARVERAKVASGPRKLSDRETQFVAVVLAMDIMKDAPSLTLVEVPIDALPDYVKDMATRDRSNIFQRGMADPVYSGEPKAITGFKLREVTMDIYFKKLRTPAEKAAKGTRATKANGEPRTAPGKRSNKYEGLRLRKMRENPRKEGTHGYWHWKLYQDGMSYNEVMAIKDFETGPSNITSLNFKGPGLNQWMADLERGNIALYRENEPEFLDVEQTQLNPRFWAINNYYEGK